MNNMAGALRASASPFQTINNNSLPVEAAATEMETDDPYVFDDFFPSMIERVGYEGLMKELCNGFYLLMDVTKGLITFESLKRSTFILGLHDLRDDEITCMLNKGDMDGDGALNQMEFCILMLKLSPGLCSYNHPPSFDGSNSTMSNVWMEDMGMNDMQ